MKNMYKYWKMIKLSHFYSKKIELISAVLFSLCISYDVSNREQVMAFAWQKCLSFPDFDELKVQNKTAYITSLSTFCDFWKNLQIYCHIVGIGIAYMIWISLLCCTKKFIKYAVKHFSSRTEVGSWEEESIKFYFT